MSDDYPTKRPPHCKHGVFPICGCREAPSTAWEAIRKRDELRNEAEHRKNQAKVTRTAGRPPLPRPEPVMTSEEFLDLLPGIAEDPDARRAVATTIERELCTMSLAEFCQAAWPHVDPARLEWNWHHELICSILQGLFEEWEHAHGRRGARPRVVNAVFNVPPGTGKSKILCLLFPTWVWVRRPGTKFLCLSVNEEAALRDARDSRGLIRSEWFQETFRPSWSLKDDQDAISNFGNTDGGTRLSKAQASEVVGLRADIVVIDDPNNPKEAESKIVRETVNELWNTNIYNRVNDPTKSLRIGIQQRTHSEDWTGFVLKQQGTWSPTNPNGWLHVCLPAEFEPERACVTPWGSDPRTIKGESLHWDSKTKTGRLPPDFLDAERARFGTQKYAGQMQQRPTMAEGGMVKLGWWRFFQYEDVPLVPERKDRGPKLIADQLDHAFGTHIVAPIGGWVRGWDFDWTVISVDAAAKKTERGSQYGILVISGKGLRRFVRDDRTRRGDILEILKVLVDLCGQYDPDRILIEAKAAGSDLATLFRARFESGEVKGSNGKPLIVRVDEVDPNNTGKEARLDPCLPELEAGLVHVPERAEWLEPFLGEVCGFPLATFDDRVDALSQALNHMRSGANSYQLPSW